MEQAFDTDFSSIRINVGSASTDLNDRIQAKAFTVGNDIFFRGSAPDTTTVQGQHLLAHELTHTIQQRGSDGGRATRSTIQRKVGVTTTLGPRNIKGAKVSTGGSLGVVLIPSIAAKFETDPAAAIDTATAYNSLLGGGNGKAWSATSPTARAATQQEAQDIADSLERADQRKPGSAGDPTRVATMVNQFRTHPNNVVIYEQATGKDFIKYLAQGAEKTDAAVKQSEKGRAKKGSGLAQLADPGYADQLGRIAAIDIFMGHKDRLHGTGNMENWMSDVKKKKISLVDNEMSADPLALWSADNDVIDLAAHNIAAVSGRISDEIDSLLQHTGYGGGKLGAKDLAVWSNTIKPVFDTNLEKGLTAGRLLLMQRGWSLANSLGASSPLYVRLYERLDYFHLNG